MAAKKASWHWNCCSVFCKNSWRSEGVEYYTLTAFEKAPKKARDAYLAVIGRSNVNWKRHVLCSAHWSKGTREAMDDLPDVKYTTKNKKEIVDSVPSVTPSWHWNCAAALCTNSWRTPEVHYYKLCEISKDRALRNAYDKILKNKHVNWKRHVICSEHWSSGKRNSIQDLPDKSSSEKYLQNKPSFITPKRKLESAKRSLEFEGDCGERKKPRRKMNRSAGNDTTEELIDAISGENSKLRDQLLEVQEKLQQKEKELSKLVEEVTTLRTEREEYKRQLAFFQNEFERTRFSYDNVKKKGKVLYMTGLSLPEFDCLYEFLEPFLPVMVYPDCKSSETSTKQRKMDKRTELMCFLTVSRHALHLGVMGWMTNTSISTQSRLFVAWSVFLVTLFESIDLTPLPGEILAFLPKDFWEAGFGNTSCLGDCTETWIAPSENFDVNNVTFSQYKNHTTGKTSVWITPCGSLIQCSDTYPGTITDADITEQSGVLDKLEEGTIVLTDKGFGITDLCLAKGLHHNRPPLKYNAQYDETEISRNFDIATLRIYNENYIGKIRDWAILNACWPISRIDILGYVHKVFAHVVNILKKPVCPKEI